MICYLNGFEEAKQKRIDAKPFLKAQTSQTVYQSFKEARTHNIALAALIGPIKANFNWQITLFAFAVMIALAWFIMQFLNINKQVERVVNLENSDAGNQMTIVN